jgi:hypothetical protein
MNAKTILLLMAVFTMGIVNAQDKKGERENKKEELEAQKVAFITTKLDLTTEESKVFWPVYDEREKEIRDVRKKIREKAKDGKDMDNLTDEEVKKMMEEVITLKKEELEIEEKYNKKLQELIPVKKVAKLYVAERKFNEEVLRAWKDKQGEGKGKPSDK